MMRLDDSREAGLLNPSTQYSSLEMQMSDFDLPMPRRPRSRSRCYVVGVVFALVVVAAIVSGSVAGGKRNAQDDDPDKSDHMRSGPVRNLAPAPSPEEFVPEAGFASAPPAPAVAIAEPVSSPPAASEPAPSSPASSPLPPFESGSPFVGTPPVAGVALSPNSLGFGEIGYERVCNETIDIGVCLNLFESNPNSSKVDLQQWTIMAMEAAEQALNESLALASHLKESSDENVALEQCIDVFSEAFVLVNESMYVLADMDVENPGTTGADIREALNAAMTNHETCQEGINDIGAFPGSDQITGEQARRVNTYLSIVLTFFNELMAASEDTIPDDPHDRRRLLEIESTARRLILGRRALLSTRSLQRAGRLSPGATFS